MANLTTAALVELLEAEGAKAFRSGAPAGACPYAFDKTPCFPTDIAGFNRNFRAKMDAWMRGWMGERDRSLEPCPYCDKRFTNVKTHIRARHSAMLRSVEKD